MSVKQLQTQQVLSIACAGSAERSQNCEWTFLFGKEKKRAYREEMRLFLISFVVVTIVALLGAIVETTIPGFFSKKFKSGASAITLGLLGIACSILLLMVFLKARIREGFEDTSSVNRWNAMVAETKVSDVCKLYTEMYEKIMLVEKGAPPEPVKSDAQAREATDRQFSGVMSLTPVSCSLFQEVDSKKETLDALFMGLQKLPDNFFAQVVETAKGCRSLLIQQFTQVEEAERKRKEGFDDFTVCNEAAAKERKEKKEEKKVSKEATQCVLVEEIPPESKEKAIKKKLDAMETALKQYRQSSTVKDSLQKILDDAMYYKNELDKKKKEAEQMSNKYNL